MIQDLGFGSGTFVKINQAQKVTGNTIVSFGETHMLVKVFQNRVKIRFVEGPKVNQQFTFGPEQENISIGRMQDCTIQFDATSLSRYQCGLRYNPEIGWLLYDGTEIKGSTNGTWLFVDEPCPLYDGTTLKAGTLVFNVHVTAS